MISSIVSRLVILLFGTLYPAYASYKAVRTKDVREYVKWMMYWIVFALFTCAETFTDVLLSFWFPFYYEIKIIVVLWLLSPATRGSSILYRKFVHPTLTKREKEIDEAIMHAKAQGYSTILRLGARGVDYAKYVIMQTAIKGGGGLMNQLRKSYSLSDLTDNHGEPRYRAIGLGSLQEEQDSVDHERADVHFMRRSIVHPAHHPGLANSPIDVYFSELDLDLKQRGRTDRHSVVGIPQSMEDISSGYSSADPLFSLSQGNSPTDNRGLEDIFLRSSSMGSAHMKSKKSAFNDTISPNKSSDEVTSLVEELDGPPLSSSIVSPSIISELKHLLSSRKGDINDLLTSEVQLKDQTYVKTSENIVTKTELPYRRNDDLSKISPNTSSFSDAGNLFNPSLTNQSSERSRSNSSADISSDGVQDSRDRAGRAGRYRKLRAPGPPSKSTGDTESTSDFEHGSVVKARMSLVSSRRLSGSVNILVESSGSPKVPAVELDTKPTKILLLRRKVKLHDRLTPSALLRKKIALLNHSSSLPNLPHALPSFKPNTAEPISRFLKMKK